jgi:hypothetical protein
MIPARAILYVRPAAWVALGLALAPVASAQDLNSINRHTIYTNFAQHLPTEAISDRLYNGTSSLAIKPKPEAKKAENSVGAGNPLWAIPLASLTATRERPIFLPSRRPPPGLELASVQPQPVSALSQSRRPNLSLVGAITGEAEGIAIFLDETTKGIVRMKTGESRSGWILRLVTKRQATLQKGSETAVLVLPSSTAK